MKKRVIAFIAALTSILVMTLIPVQPASADQYTHYFAGNYETAAYGAQASISTPSSKPSLSSTSCISSWIQVPGDSNDWVSTGWMFCNFSGYNTNNAQPFTEWAAGGYDDQSLYSTQSWGSSCNYKVVGSGEEWYLYISGNLEVYGYNESMPTAPTAISAESEVTNSTSDALYSNFNNVEWLDSGSNWNLFNQNNFSNSSSYYSVHSTYDYQYYISGPN